MPDSAPTTPVTIGTAGHIDHGKTLLVEKLTGMRADRPYERERGMTIDIGYAEMAAPDGRRIGFVDLPGHERFIRNMVAGASGIDLALVVVAADDGVMPQTREHLEILDLLGVHRGVVVLNKIDLVDEEMRELAMEELTEFLADTGLRDAPILSCSAETGEGVDAVREALVGLVTRDERESDPGAFFLAVQRTFAATGFGCIATGVPAAGSVHPGDELELLPSGKKARVRAIQVYHEPAEQASAGHRTALNLSGISKDEVARGMVVAAPGAYRPTRHIAVRLNVLSSAKRPEKHAAGARFLSGTLEEMAKIYLPSGDALMPGESAIVEIRTGDRVTVKDGAPFIVRSDNAKETIGGGIVVSSLEGPIGRKDPARVARLEAWEAALQSPRDRVLGALESRGAAAPRTLAIACQLDSKAVNGILESLEREQRATQLVDGTFVLQTRLEEAIKAIPERLAKMHEKNPLLATLAVADVRDALGYSEAVFMSAIQQIGDPVVLDGRSVRLASHSVTLDEELEQAANALLSCLDKARFAPPPRDQLAQCAGLADDELQRALTLLRDRDQLREVAPGVFYPRDLLEEGLRLLQRVSKERGHFEPVEAKTAFGGISRKWLIPLLEYFDKIGATRRDQNHRFLTPRGVSMAENGMGGSGS